MILRSYLLGILVSCTYRTILAYYKLYTCYGTGECSITLHTGGIVDDLHRWPVECHDGEAMIGINGASDWSGLSTAWCKFMFPKKKPTFGIYPYYEYCNVRDLDAMFEYYCYDKYFPIDTYDTFVTAYSAAQAYNESNNGDVASNNGEVYKCCKLPTGYHLDYSRCEYKYTHDRFGEHYDENNMFPSKCDPDFLLTGMGKAEDPWMAVLHYVWFQCCPLFYDPDYVPLFENANRTLQEEYGLFGRSPRYKYRYGDPNANQTYPNANQTS